MRDLAGHPGDLLQTDGQPSHSRRSLRDCRRQQGVLSRGSASVSMGRRVVLDDLEVALQHLICCRGARQSDPLFCHVPITIPPRSRIVMIRRYSVPRLRNFIDAPARLMGCISPRRRSARSRPFEIADRLYHSPTVCWRSTIVQRQNRVCLLCDCLYWNARSERQHGQRQNAVLEYARRRASGSRLHPCGRTAHASTGSRRGST
jgi:hypothetical protein